MSPDGYLRELTEEKPIRPKEVEVPHEQLEDVINMNRQQRRAWHRRQVKAQRRA